MHAQAVLPRLQRLRQHGGVFAVNRHHIGGDTLILQRQALDGRKLLRLNEQTDALFVVVGGVAHPGPQDQPASGREKARRGVVAFHRADRLVELRSQVGLDHRDQRHLRTLATKHRAPLALETARVLRIGGP